MLGFFPALVLTGARQTGKTTLLADAFPGYRYISLDLPSTAAMAEDSPEEFFARNPPPCIIDEVQYAPGLFRHLKSRIDVDRHAMGYWILIGSRKFTLMKEVSDSLAGRAAILELEGLSLAELAGLPEAVSAGVEGFIARGGFPELWRVPGLPAAEFFSAYLSSYLSSYLERDVRQLLNVGSLRDFERFIRVLAARNACELDLSAVGAAVGAAVGQDRDRVALRARGLEPDLSPGALARQCREANRQAPQSLLQGHGAPVLASRPVRSLRGKPSLHGGALGDARLR